VSDAALRRVYLVCKRCCGRGHVRVCAFISRILAHPSAALASHELLVQLTAHPLYCLASQINFARWRAMLRCHTPSPGHSPHWYVTGIDVGLQQRRAVLCGGALLSVLVPRLLCVQGECGDIYPLNLARRMASRRHFLGSNKDEAEGVFEEGQRLHGEQRFSEAAERWGRAALLRHAPSHAHLSNVLILGRPGVAKTRSKRLSWLRLGRRWAARTAREHSAAATFTVVVLPKTKREGLRWEGRARRRAAALGSLWLELLRCGMWL
jgi:hypothetical protein